MEGWTHVADLFEFAPDGAGAESVFVVVQEDGAAVAIGCQGRVGSLGREHAASHCGVGAFDFGDVEEAGRVADEGSAGEGAFRDGLEPAFVEGSSAVGDTCAAFDDGFVDGMVFHFLKFTIRGEPGVGIVQTNDEA